MYKLLCSNLTKSQKSLSNFTGYYRKVAQKCNKCNVASKYNSQSELHNNQSIEDVEAEEPLETDPSPDNINSYTAFCGRKIKKAKAEPPIAGLSRVPSNHKKIDPVSRRAFKNKEAVLYYQSAVDQCTRIKKKLERYNQLVTLSRPPRLVSDIKKALNIPEPEPRKFKPQKRNVLRTKQIKNDRVVTELNKIDDIKTAKPSSQFKDTKIKITYPTHKLRYKMGTQGYKLEHKVVSKSGTKTVVKDPLLEHLQSIKIQHSKTSEKPKATVMKPRNTNQKKKIPILNDLLHQKYFEENSERHKQQKKFENAMMQLHPTLKKACAFSKMSFKHSYNKLMKKSGFTYQRPKKSSEKNKDDNKEDTIAVKKEEQPEKGPTVISPLPASITNTKEVFMKDPKVETTKYREAVIEHPASTGNQTPPGTSTKHPKPVLSDKFENYDIDAVCIKTNANSNINTHGDYVAESEPKVKKFVEAQKKENQNETEAESQIKKMPSKVTNNEIAESFSKYLLKLKELRDRTALDKPYFKKTELDNQQGKADKIEDQKTEDVASKFQEKTEKTSSTNEIQRTTDKEIESRSKTDGLTGKRTEKIEYAGNKKVEKYEVLDKHTDKYKIRLAKSNESRGNFARSQSADSLKPDKSLVMKSFAMKSIKTQNPEKVRKKRAASIPSVISDEDKSPQRIEKIMDKYRVQTNFMISAAEMKRIDRKKRREREKLLREDVKMQQKKLDEALVGENKVRKHKYKLENFEKTSQKAKEKIDLGGDQGLILKEAQNVEKKKNPEAKETIGDSLERKEEPASKLETDLIRTKDQVSVKDMKQYAENLLNEQIARENLIEGVEMEHVKMLEDTKKLKEILEQFVIKEREKKFKYILTPKKEELPVEKDKPSEGKSSVKAKYLLTPKKEELPVEKDKPSEGKSSVKAKYILTPKKEELPVEKDKLLEEKNSAKAKYILTPKKEQLPVEKDKPLEGKSSVKAKCILTPKKEELPVEKDKPLEEKNSAKVKYILTPKKEELPVEKDKPLEGKSSVKAKFILTPKKEESSIEKDKPSEGKSSVKAEEKPIISLKRDKDNKDTALSSNLLDKNVEAQTKQVISLKRDKDNKDPALSSKLLDRKFESQTRDGPGQENINDLQAKEKINNYIEDDVKMIDKLFSKIPKVNLEREIRERVPKVEQRIRGKALKEEDKLIKSNIERPPVNMSAGKHILRESLERKDKPSEKEVEEVKNEKQLKPDKLVENKIIPEDAKTGLEKKQKKLPVFGISKVKHVLRESLERKDKFSEKEVEEVKYQKQLIPDKLVENKIIPEDTKTGLEKKQKKLPVFGISKFKKRSNHEMTQKKKTIKLDDKKNLSKETVTSKKSNRAQRENLKKLKDASNRLVKLVKKGDADFTGNDRGKFTFPKPFPTIRKDKTPPSKEKRKREFPKTRKDIVLPPKHRNYPPKQYTKGKTNALAEFKDASRKTDKIMPRTAQDNPNITPRDKIFTEPQKKPEGDIVKDIKHATVEKKEFKKTKSLAVLVSEQREKILKQLDMSWEQERNKMEQMKEAFENVSKDRLQENREIDKDLRIGLINSRRYAKDYLQTTNEPSKAKTPLPLDVTRDNALVKDTKENIDRPRLIISLRYRASSANNVVDNNIKKLQPSFQVEDEKVKRVSSADSRRSVYKQSRSLKPLNLERTEAILKKPKNKINIDKSSAQGQSLKTTEEDLFVKRKRSRIEEYMIKKTAAKDDLNIKQSLTANALKTIKNPQNLQLTPKDVLTHTQRDLDLSFSSLKRGRIEDEMKMYSKGVGNKNNKDKDGTAVVNKVTEIQQAADKPKREIMEENKVPLKTLSTDVKPVQKEISNKQIGTNAEAQKQSLEQFPLLNSKTLVREIAKKLEAKAQSMKVNARAHKLPLEQFPVLNSKTLAREIAKKLEAKAHTIKVKAELIKKAIKTASEVEINKKVIRPKTSGPIRITKTVESVKKSAPVKLRASCLITRMQADTGTPTRSGKSSRKYNRRSNRPTTDPKKTIEKDPSSDHNVKKMMNAMSQADKQLEKVLKCYEICKIPQSTIRKHNTSKLTKRTDDKLLDQAFKKTLDSKTFIIGATEGFNPRIKAKLAMKLDSTKKEPLTDDRNKKNMNAEKSETGSTNALTRGLKKSNNTDKTSRKDNKKKPAGPAKLTKPTTKGNETLSLVYLKEVDKQFDRKKSCSIKNILSSVQFDVSREVSKVNFINNLLLREPSIKDIVVNKISMKCIENTEYPANKVVVSNHSTVTCSKGPDPKPTGGKGGEGSHKISENKLFIQMEGGKDTSGNKIVVMSSNGKTEECEKDASKKSKNTDEIPGKRTTIVTVSNAPEMQVSMSTDYPHDTSTLQNIEKTQHNREIRKKWTNNATKEQSCATKRNKTKSESTEPPLQRENGRTKKLPCVIHKPSAVHIYVNPRKPPNGKPTLNKPAVKKKKSENYGLKDKPKSASPNAFSKRAGVKTDRTSIFGYPKSKRHKSAQKSRKKTDNEDSSMPFWYNDNIEALLMASFVENKLEELRTIRKSFGCQTSNNISPIKSHESRTVGMPGYLNLKQKAKQIICQVRTLIQRQLEVLRAVILSTWLTYAMVQRSVSEEHMHLERATEEKIRNGGNRRQFTKNNMDEETKGLHRNYKLRNPCLHEAYDKVENELTLAENRGTGKSKSICKRKFTESELAESKNLLSSRKNGRWYNCVKGNDESEEVIRGVKRTDQNFDSKSVIELFKAEKPASFGTISENSCCEECIQSRENKKIVNGNECKQQKGYDYLMQQTPSCEDSEIYGVSSDFSSCSLNEKTTFPRDKNQHNYMQSSSEPTSMTSLENQNKMLNDYNIETHSEPNSKSNVSNGKTKKKSSIYTYTIQKIKRLLKIFNKENSEAMGPPDSLKLKKSSKLWKRKTDIDKISIKPTFPTKRYTALMPRSLPVSKRTSNSCKIRKTDNIIIRNTNRTISIPDSEDHVYSDRSDITDVEFSCSNKRKELQTWVPDSMEIEENQHKIFPMYSSNENSDEHKFIPTISQTEIKNIMNQNDHKLTGLLKSLTSTINTESTLSRNTFSNYNLRFDATENQKDDSSQPGDTKDFFKQSQIFQTKENQTSFTDMIQCPISGIWTQKIDYQSQTTLISLSNKENKEKRTPWNIENKMGQYDLLTARNDNSISQNSSLESDNHQNHRELVDFSQNPNIDEIFKHKALHHTDLLLPKNEGGTRNSILNPDDKNIHLLTSSQYDEGSNNRQLLVCSQNGDVEDFFRQSISPYVTENQRKIFDKYFTKIQCSSGNSFQKMRNHKNMSELPIYLQNGGIHDLSRHTVTLREQIMKNKICTLLKSVLNTDNQQTSGLSVQSQNESSENPIRPKLTDHKHNNKNNDIKQTSELCIPRNEGSVTRIAILQADNHDNKYRELSVQKKNEDVEIISQKETSENEEAFSEHSIVNTDNENKSLPEQDASNSGILTTNIENQQKRSEMVVIPQNEIFKQLLTLQVIENITDSSDFITPTNDRTFKSEKTIENDDVSGNLIMNTDNQNNNSELIVFSHNDHEAISKNQAAPTTQNEGRISRNLNIHNQKNLSLESESKILRNLFVNVGLQLLISSHNDYIDPLSKQMLSFPVIENTGSILGSRITNTDNQNQRSLLLIASHNDDTKVLTKSRLIPQIIESEGNIVSRPIINSVNQNQRSQLQISSYKEDTEALDKRTLTPQIIEKIQSASDGCFRESEGGISENSKLKFGNNESKSEHLLVLLQGYIDDIVKGNLIPQTAEYKRKCFDLVMCSSKIDLAHKTDGTSENKQISEDHSKPKLCVLNRVREISEMLTNVCSGNTVNQPPVIPLNENIEKDSSKQKQPPKNTDNERDPSDLFIPTRKNENNLSGPEMPILPRGKETYISHTQKQLEGITQIIANRTEFGGKEAEPNTSKSTEFKMTAPTQKVTAPPDEQSNNVKNPIKARIEEIFKKHCNEEEKICKFNKNLVKHVKRSEETVKKEEVLPNKESKPPEGEEKKQKILEMQKFLVSELKKQGHESKSSLENKDKQETKQDQKKESLQKSPIYIEKNLPKQYGEKKESNTSIKPVASICERLCMPLKKLSQIALKAPVEEATTLNKYCEQKVHNAPKIKRSVSEKYKGLKIMYLKIKRKTQDENFVPMMLSLKNNKKEPVVEKPDNPDTVKRQILEFRYELLRKLHQEFSNLYAEDFRENLGKFERVAKFYKSVTKDMSQNETDNVQTSRSKSMEELLGPCSRPSFWRVARFYNLILQKNKNRRNSQAKEPTTLLVNKLPNDVDKDRNKLSESEVTSSKCEKGKTNGKYPDDSGRPN